MESKNPRASTAELENSPPSTWMYGSFAGNGFSALSLAYFDSRSDGLGSAGAGNACEKIIICGNLPEVMRGQETKKSSDNSNLKKACVPWVKARKLLIYYTKGQLAERKLE
ncbi:hypothetical protein TWF132_000974 [Orbilia oligospora]|nr:hypothetical protein TWF132_000974 [Orbilia oligospora]